MLAAVMGMPQCCLLAMLCSLLSTFQLITPDDPSFALKEKLEFKGRETAVVKKSDISTLLNLPVRNGSSDLERGYGVELTRHDHTTFVAQSCNEWRAGIRDGAYAATTYDMAMERFMIHTCGLLFELQRAAPPRKSFVRKVTLASVKVLPAQMLGRIGDKENGVEPRKPSPTSIASVVKQKELLSAKATSLRVRHGDLDQLFREAARADFDGDGFEDILIFGGAQAVGGTMGFAWYEIVTRRKPTGLLESVQTLL